MKYFDEMRSKYGFGDGESVPDGVEKYRDVYVRAINALAEKKGSKSRVKAFDRAGIHNWCLIEFVDENGVETYDDAMDEVIVELMGADLDQFIRVQVSVNEDELDRFLSDMTAGQSDERTICAKCDVCAGHPEDGDEGDTFPERK